MHSFILADPMPHGSASGPAAITNLSLDELDAVGGGVAPLLAAIAVTYVKVRFIDGVFQGTAASARS